jgi:predicted ATPase
MKRSGITRITIESFKGIRDQVDIPVRPITLLFGANSAGKSTILQALLYLRELLERQNVDADRLLASGASINLGGFRQFVHQHDLSRHVQIGVTLAVDEDGLPVYPVAIPWMDDRETVRTIWENGLSHVEEVTVSVTVQWDETLQAPWITAYEVGVNGQLFGRIEADSERQAYLTLCDFEHPVLMKEFGTRENGDDELNPESQAILNTLEARNLLSESSSVSFRIPLATRVIPEWGKTLLADNPKSNSLAAREHENRKESDVAEPGSGEDEGRQFGLTQFLISHVMVGAGEVVLDALRGIRYIGPLRHIPDRNFNPLRSPVEERWADGSAAWDLLYKSAAGLKSEGLVNRVSNILSSPERLNLGYRLETQHVYEVAVDGFAIHLLTALALDREDADIEEKVRLILDDIRRQPQELRLTLIDQSKDTYVDPCDIGSGVSQIIPVIVGAMDGFSGLATIEQPELHMHPAVQCSLADVFVREVNKELDKTFLLETHSEHLLLRMMKRMRQTSVDDYPDSSLSLTADQITIVFVETYDSRSVFREMPLNERGEFIKAWPGGFFEEDLGELM